MGQQRDQKNQKIPWNKWKWGHNNPKEDITPVNMYAPNIGAPKYVKPILMDIKGEIDRNTVIVWDVYTPLTSMDRSSRQKIKKETGALNEH